MELKQSRRAFLGAASAAAAGAALAPLLAHAQQNFIPISPYFGTLLTRTSINTVEINNIVDRLVGQVPLLTDVALNTDVWRITGHVKGYTSPVGCMADMISDMALGIGTYCNGNTDNGTCEVHGCRDDQCRNLTCGNNHCNGQSCDNNQGCTNKTDPFNLDLEAWMDFKDELLALIGEVPMRKFDIRLTYNTQNYVFPT